jgi:large subunit ribosomal protein L7A
LQIQSRGDRCRFVLEVLKNGNRAIGIKQTLKAVENNSAKLVFIARDADEKVTGNLKELCISNDVAVEYVETMKQLGKAVGIEVGASAACLLK